MLCLFFASLSLELSEAVDPGRIAVDWDLELGLADPRSAHTETCRPMTEDQEECRRQLLARQASRLCL